MSRRALMYCPICDMEKVESQLLFDPNQVFCEKNPIVHKWTDSQALMALSPRLIKKPKEADAIQSNYTELKLLVPEPLKKALEAKFPENLSASVRSVLQACAEPLMMILNATDLMRIKDRVGKTPRTANEMIGIIFAFGEEIRELKNEVVGLKRRVSITLRGNEAGVIVDLEDQLPKAVAKANASGVTLEELLSNHLKTALANDWLEG